MEEVERRESVSCSPTTTIFLESLSELIDRQPELGVVGLAENGLEAIEQADELDPDAVVLDLHMPLVDGVTAAARLRHDHPSICLIALTGDDAPASRGRQGGGRRRRLAQERARGRPARPALRTAGEGA